jgi:ADP-heptose:LPS heptosyltransferase
MTIDERVEKESARLVKEFLEAFESSGQYLRNHIARLAMLATSENEETAELATGAFFTSLVEPLADSFDPRAVSLYNRAFAQLIQHCRKIDRSKAFDAELTRFGLRGEPEIVARAEALGREPAPSGRARLEVRRVIVVSRVTLGADVAITSVIIEATKRACPEAKIALVGGRKARELFGGDERISFEEISYSRTGRTLERLLSWVDLLACVRKLTSGLNQDQYLILDPDSRLTQLGLLPISEGNYLFFPSREYGSDTSHSLAQLTASWLKGLFGFEEPLFPNVSLARHDLARASELVKRVRREARPVVSINFGVGANPRKRVGDGFEVGLVNHLIRDGAAIILDKGAGEDELRRASEVIESAARISLDGRAVRVVEMNEENLETLLSSDKVDSDLMVWNGRIGMLAALVGESDLYIGYDSAGQHIAAAQATPRIDVFAGFSSPRMLDRWRPTGKGESRIVAVDNQSASDTLSAALRHAREMMRNSRQ